MLATLLHRTEDRMNLGRLAKQAKTVIDKRGGMAGSRPTPSS